jgi:hypothetical protein
VSFVTNSYVGAAGKERSSGSGIRSEATKMSEEGERIEAISNLGQSGELIHQEFTEG